MPEEINIKESIYDQKSFIQIRIHELFIKIDRANFNPFLYNYPLNGRIRDEDNLYNYEVAFNGLCSVLLTIRSKLTDGEKEILNKEREKLMDIIDTGFNFKFKDALGKKGTSTDIGFKKNIINGLFIFRGLIEDAMNAHGFNPDKEDVGKSIIKM